MVVRDPVILVLLLIAFFSSISGKPLDGLLLLLVAAGLAGDARTRSRRVPAAPAGGEPPGTLAPGAAAVDAAAAPVPRRGIRRLAAVAVLAAGVCYAVIGGSFSRFSWPATAAVVSVGTVVVLAGWQPRRRPQPDRGPLPRTGVAPWGAAWSRAAVELFAVPAADHGHHVLRAPTISAPTDPAPVAEPGRVLVLGGWLLLGWYRVRRGTATTSRPPGTR